MEIRGWDWPAEVGLSRADRKKRRAEIDGEIEKLESELQSITESANQAGLKVA